MKVYFLSDGVQAIRYLVDVNGLRPAKIYFRIKNVIAEAPYIQADEEVVFLLVVQGCTTMRPVDIVNLLETLKRLNVFKDIIVYTNVPLPQSPVTYTLYDGDIFSGYEVDVDVGVTDVNTLLNGKVSRKQNTKIKLLCTDMQYKATKTQVVSKPYIAVAQDVNSLNDVAQLRCANIFK